MTEGSYAARLRGALALAGAASLFLVTVAGWTLALAARAGAAPGLAAAFRTWLYSTVRNACLMKRRRRAGEPARFEEPEEVASTAPRPDERMVDAWIDRRLRAALSSLPAAYRMIVVLREIEGLTTKEVATVSGISEANVKTRLHRAHAMLRKKLHDV